MSGRRAAFLAACLALGPSASRAEGVVRMAKADAAGDRLLVSWTETSASLRDVLWSADPATVAAGAVLGVTDAGSLVVDGLPGAYIVRPHSCTDDDREDDDTYDTRAIGGFGLLGRICAYDEDWIGGYLLCGESASAEIRFDPAEGDLDLDVLRGWPPVLVETSSTGTGVERVTAVGDVADSWFFRVRGVGAAEASYEADAWIPWEGCIDDDYRADDDAASARPIPVRHWAEDMLCPCGDEDWFAIDLGPSQQLAVTLVSTGSDCVTSGFAQLLEADGVTPIDRTDPGGGLLSTTAPPAGARVHVRVACGPGGNDERYQLDVVGF